MKQLILSAAMICALSGVASANNNTEDQTKPGKAETECYREVMTLPVDKRDAAFIRCMEERGYDMPQSGDQTGERPEQSGQ